jgi:hypothetical protein
MKAVILEHKNGYVYALQKDGRVIKSRQLSGTVGSEVDIKTPIMAQLRWMTAAAACFILLFCTTAYAMMTPVTYISFDINPSFEFAVNRFEHVISIQTYNEDSARIFHGNTIRFKSIPDAVKQSMILLDQSGFLSHNEQNQIMISVADQHEPHAKVIAQRVIDTIEQLSHEYHYRIRAHQSIDTLERVHEAHELGTTPGKLRLIQMLTETSGNSDSTDQNTWISEPVKKILEEVERHRVNQQEKSPDGTNNAPSDPPEGREDTGQSNVSPPIPNDLGGIPNQKQSGQN